MSKENKVKWEQQKQQAMHTVLKKRPNQTYNKDGVCLSKTCRALPAETSEQV